MYDTIFWVLSPIHQFSSNGGVRIDYPLKNICRAFLLVDTHAHTHTHIYIYMRVCVCVCHSKAQAWSHLNVSLSIQKDHRPHSCTARNRDLKHNKEPRLSKGSILTVSHTHIYIYIYIISLIFSSNRLHVLFFCRPIISVSSRFYLPLLPNPFAHHCSDGLLCRTRSFTCRASITPEKRLT